MSSFILNNYYSIHVAAKAIRSSMGATDTVSCWGMGFQGCLKQINQSLHDCTEPIGAQTMPYI